MLDRSKGDSMRCSQDTFEVGYKMQMNDIASSIGLANLCHTDRLLERNRRNAMMYDSALSSNKSVHTYNIRSASKSSYWLYTVLVEDAVDFIRYMKNEGISCGKVHTRNDSKHLFKACKRKGMLLGLKEFDDKHVCIPVGWWLTDTEVYKVCSAIRSYNYGCNYNSDS